MSPLIPWRWPRQLSPIDSIPNCMRILFISKQVYSLELLAGLGAIAAEVDQELRNISYRYGLRIGEAYQIADDVKEVRSHLLRRSIFPKQMAALAPALFYFVSEMSPFILNVLKGNCADLESPVLELFGVAAELMEHEIEHRLQSAVSEIEGHFPNNGYSDLAKRAPKDIIMMFNES